MINRQRDQHVRIISVLPVSLRSRLARGVQIEARSPVTFDPGSRKDPQILFAGCEVNGQPAARAGANSGTSLSAVGVCGHAPLRAALHTHQRVLKPPVPPPSVPSPVGREKVMT